MNKLQNQVIAVLEDTPESRNSDITLTIEIWKRFYPQLTINGECSGIRLDALYDLPREDNIKRIRARLNARGKFWPTIREVALHRRINEDDWRKFMGYPILPRDEVKTSKPMQKEINPMQNDDNLVMFDVPQVNAARSYDEFSNRHANGRRK